MILNVCPIQNKRFKSIAPKSFRTGKFFFFVTNLSFFDNSKESNIFQFFFLLLVWTRCLLFLLWTNDFFLVIVLHYRLPGRLFKTEKKVPFTELCRRQSLTLEPLLSPKMRKNNSRNLKHSRQENTFRGLTTCGNRIPLLLSTGPGSSERNILTGFPWKRFIPSPDAGAQGSPFQKTRLLDWKIRIRWYFTSTLISQQK